MSKRLFTVCNVRFSLLDGKGFFEWPTIAHQEVIRAIQDEFAAWGRFHAPELHIVTDGMLVASHDRGRGNVGRDRKAPDLLIWKDRKAFCTHAHPSVVLEVAYTSGISEARKKAASYLFYYNKPPITLVLILDFHFMDSERKKVKAVYLEHWEVWHHQRIADVARIGEEAKVPYCGSLGLQIETWDDDTQQPDSPTHSSTAIIARRGKRSKAQQISIAMTKRKLVGSLYFWRLYH